eukprot:TRINITY_DN1780_c0_g1_i1.p1 TRINITY_DN1780_c0_g1~~TRINITY_DN1780_c0_g1_i1.p1  ORF type:complete len:116 (-),score=19.88 TRINITY_DN1780_c0_g1_i1:309-656(-)
MNPHRERFVWRQFFSTKKKTLLCVRTSSIKNTFFSSSTQHSSSFSNIFIIRSLLEKEGHHCSSFVPFFDSWETFETPQNRREASSFSIQNQFETFVKAILHIQTLIILMFFKGMG